MDEARVRDIISQVQTGSQLISDKLEDTVLSITEELDTVMHNVFNEVIQSPEDTSIEVLERYYGILANVVYFVGTNAEKLNIMNDVSKMEYKNKYNSVYLYATTSSSNEKKLTVAAITARTELETEDENAVNTIYNNAYKVVKFKITAAQEMMRCLSKMISRRMAEVDVSNISADGNAQVLLG